MRITPPIQVDKKDMVQLSSWAESRPVHRLAQRARIVLLSAQGLGPTAIAQELSCTRQTVVNWRERYRTAGITGLVDAPRSGRPPSVSSTDILLRTLAPPPLGFQRWSSRLLGSELGISNASVASAWRAWGISPAGHGRLRLGTEPVLDADVARVVGLHLADGVGALALECGAPVPGDRIPVGRRPDVGDLDADGGPGRHPDAEGQAVAFLRSLPADGVEPPHAAIVAGTCPWWRRLDEGRPLVIHVAGPDVSWSRLVRVACLMAGAHPRGAASVAALHAALGRRGPAAVFSWRVG